MRPARTKWEVLCAAIAAKEEALPSPNDASAIVLGRNQVGAPVCLSETLRLQHAHVVGTTGAGKTTLLEHCARQDIAARRGVCFVDPHGDHPGSSYRSLLGWMKESGFINSRILHLVDPNAPTHVTGFDPLTLPDETYEPAVIADAALEAFERVWGEEDTNTKPTIQRVLSAVFAALCELRLTLAEARLLFDLEDRAGIRAWAIESLRDEEAREELQYLHDIANEPRGRQDFRKEVLGPRNRLAKMTRTEAIRTMVGQQAGSGRTLDFRQALDEGHVILVNLAGGPRASDKSCQLLGRLLTRFLFFNAQRRQRPDRPFFFYLDECQLYLSGDVSRMLAECRKYGVGVVLSHQYLGQLEEAGPDILQAVRNCTNVKVAFRVKDPMEAEDLAHMVVPLDLEMPLRASIRPTPIGVELVRLKGESSSEQLSSTEMRTQMEGKSYTETTSYAQSRSSSEARGVSEATSDAVSMADGSSQAQSVGSGTGLSTTEMLSPYEPFIGAPALLGVSEGANAMSHTAQATGSSSTRGASSGSTRGRSSTQGETAGEAWGEAVSFGTHRATATGVAGTRGRGETRGSQEAFKPIYQDLPGSFHGKENVLYLAAQTLRNLTTGKAFINFLDASGTKAGLLTVPSVRSRAPSAAEFEELRIRIFDGSSSATPIEEARTHLSNRQRALAARGEQARLPAEPETPAGWRSKKVRPLKVRS
jgi:hypothetical protein